jgi:hypothetical protein
MLHFQQGKFSIPQAVFYSSLTATHTSALEQSLTTVVIPTAQ